MKNTIATILLACLAHCAAQAQIRVTCTGGYIVSQTANSNIVFKDAYFSIPAQTLPAVTGNFIPGTGKVKFTGTGTNAQSYIRMDDTLNSSLYNLVIDKSLNNTKLGSNVKIRKSVTLVNGGLDLTNKKLLMNNATDALLTGESETRRVSGTTGYVERVKSLNAPAAGNPSNMGAIITSAANLGNTTVRRANIVSTLPSGASVQRLYRIKKSGAATATFTLRFSYFDVELNGNNEATMVLWRKIGAGAWAQLGATARDAAANWVEFNACSLPSTQEVYFTLGPPTISLIRQVEGEDIVENDLGNTSRLAMGDDTGNWSAYPNPVLTTVTLDILSPAETDVVLEWRDATGRLAQSEKVFVAKGTNIVQADLRGLAAGTYLVSCKGIDLKPFWVVKVGL